MTAVMGLRQQHLAFPQELPGVVTEELGRPMEGGDETSPIARLQ